MDVIRAIESFSYYNRMTGKSEREWEEWRKEAREEWGVQGINLEDFPSDAKPEEWTVEAKVQRAVEKYERKRGTDQPFILKREGITDNEWEVCKAIQQAFPQAQIFKSDYLGYFVYETREQKTAARKMIAEEMRYRRALLYKLTDEFIELMD